MHAPARMYEVGDASISCVRQEESTADNYKSNIPTKKTTCSVSDNTPHRHNSDGCRNSEPSGHWFHSVLLLFVYTTTLEKRNLSKICLFIEFRFRALR